MRKESQWSREKGFLTATMATLRDINIIPATPWKWYPAEDQDVDWTYTGAVPWLSTGPAQVQTQARSFVSPAKSGNRRHSTITARVRKNGVDMTILRRHHKQLASRGAHTRAEILCKLATI